MKFDNNAIKNILLDGAYITEADVKKAEDYMKLHRSEFVNALLSEDLITKDIIGQAVAESLGVPYFDLNSNTPSREQVLAIPEDAARKLRVVLAAKKTGGVVVAVDDPKQDGLAGELATVFPGVSVEIMYSLPEDIDASFAHYHKELETRFSKIIEMGIHVAPEILGAIFVDAVTLDVSDIHFEPTGDVVLVRFRIDGVLRDAGKLPKEQYENVLNRIKVQSGIRLDEHFSAQDGAMQFKKEGTSIDLRTSIVPTIEGEKVVLRVLSSYVQGLVLAELGLSPKHQKMIRDAAEKPAGMIIVSGPTGSGKTTTLYSLLKTLNQSDVNITTIEDPVEYKMQGINQIQVNLATELTFAKGLRSIVRQDPDIILVGEIRDNETAEIAVNAALTGHLLFSTFHANDAATVVPRLLDMNIEPFLLASTLELIVAQRLARKICTSCRYSTAVPTAIFKRQQSFGHYFEGDEVTLYQGKGCKTCGGSGYKGRVALFEFISITSELQTLFLKNPSAQEIWKVAREQGAQSLFEDGIDKVKNGITTLEELLRVAEPPKKAYQHE